MTVGFGISFTEPATCRTDKPGGYGTGGGNATRWRNIRRKAKLVAISVDLDALASAVRRRSRGCTLADRCWGV